MVTTYRQAMTTDANTGSGTSNGTVFLMDSTMPSGTDETTVRYRRCVISNRGYYSFWSLFEVHFTK